LLLLLCCILLLLVDLSWVLWGPSRHLGSLITANWVSFDFNVSYSSSWGYSLINTLKLKDMTYLDRALFMWTFNVKGEETRERRVGEIWRTERVVCRSSNHRRLEIRRTVGISQNMSPHWRDHLPVFGMYAQLWPIIFWWTDYATITLNVIEKDSCTGVVWSSYHPRHEWAEG